MSFAKKPAKHYEEPKRKIETPVEPEKPIVAAPAVLSAIAVLSDEQAPVVEAIAPPAPVADAVQPTPQEPAALRDAYRVIARRDGGFWAIKRHFAKGEPVILFVDEMSQEQIINLEGKPDSALSVEKIKV
jgi:hypothetical protein